MGTLNEVHYLLLLLLFPSSKKSRDVKKEKRKVDIVFKTSCHQWTLLVTVLEKDNMTVICKWEKFLKITYLIRAMVY